ncbi:MAG: preprotein translocase subunit YajC [Deltaproteobacteria bacterium]|nr:preprotein translocase subunit YajC [Deltaproteobacteria bacterium]
MLNLFISTAHAMAGQPGAGGAQGGGGLAGLFLPMGIVFGIFYFLMIRPQQKQAKKVKAMIEALKKGDEVVTRSGIHGKIHGLADNIVTLEIAENIRIRLNKDQVGYVKQTAAVSGE